MTPTPQQEALYEEARTGTTHIAVEAVAGAGKTTSTVNVAKAAGGRKCGFIAFNKHIAEELANRLGPAAKCCTLHSLGMAAVRRRFPAAELEQGKPSRLLQEIAPHLGGWTKRQTWYWKDDGKAALQLATLGKANLIDPDAETADVALEHLIDHHGVECQQVGAVIDAAIALLGACRDRTETFDFDDMVWLPSALGLDVEQFEMLLVDEAQDLNLAQQRLAFAACRGGRMSVCGDVFQAIYGFSGSDPDSLPNMVDSLGATARGVVRRPLTVTFRCPRSHVDMAQKVMPRIEAAPNAADGTVCAIDPRSVAGRVEPGDLVICRKNAPVISLAFRLVAADVPCKVLGRDIGTGLVALIDRLRADDCRDIAAKVERWRSAEVLRAERRRAPDSVVQSVHDRANCLAFVAAECDTVAELRQRMLDLFSDQRQAGPVVTLSSVHRAKGSEADRVFILEPGCLPMVSQKSQAWEVQQEHNILYIALTRAKRDLIFAGFVPEPLRGCRLTSAPWDVTREFDDLLTPVREEIAV